MKLHFMSDHITTNPRLESNLVLQSAGSHHLLVTLFLIVVEALSPSDMASNTSLLFSLLTVKARRHVTSLEVRRPI